MWWYEVCQRRSLNLLPLLHTHTILTMPRRALKCAPQQVIDWSMTRSSSNTTTEMRYGISVGSTDLVCSCARAHSEADRALFPHAAAPRDEVSLVTPSHAAEPLCALGCTSRWRHPLPAPTGRLRATGGGRRRRSVAVRRNRAGSAVYGQFGAVWVAANEMERWRVVAWAGLAEASSIDTDTGASSGVNGVTDGGHLGPRLCRACGCI